MLYRYKEPWWPKENFEGFAFIYKKPSNYNEAEAAKVWTRNALGLYPIRYKQNTLFMWVTGAAMRHAETLSNHEIKEDVVKIINQFLSKDYPNIPPPEEIMVCKLSCLTISQYFIFNMLL